MVTAVPEHPCEPIGRDATGLPIRRVLALPEWPDDWLDPERPQVTLAARSQRSPIEHDDTVPVIDVAATFRDARSAEWFGHWLTTKNAWSAFTTWMDNRR